MVIVHLLSYLRTIEINKQQETRVNILQSLQQWNNDYSIIFVYYFESFYYIPIRAAMSLWYKDVN